MATSRPFAYNAGSQIGTNTQKGNLAVGPTGATASYANKPGNVQWWNGPDEDLGYIIAQSASNQPNPAGIQAKVGFFRSNGKTDAAFIALAIAVAGQQFASTSAAMAWINSNNDVWTSYGSGTGSATGYGYNLVQLPYVNPATGNVIFPSVMGATMGSLNPNLLGTGGIYWSRFDNAGNDNFNYYNGATASAFTLTITQGGNTAIYSGPTGGLAYQEVNVGGTVGLAKNFYVSQVAGMTLSQAAGVTGFSTLIPVYIGVSSSYTPPTPPTPTPTGAGATGTFNLVQLPYELPVTGSVLMVGSSVSATAGILNPNLFATGGLYWSRYDVNGSDMYSSYIGATAAQSRVDIWQTGKTASYYAPTGSIFYIEDTSPGGTSYKNFGYWYQGNTGGGGTSLAWTLLSASPSNFTLGQQTNVRYTII